MRRWLPRTTRKWLRIRGFPDAESSGAGEEDGGSREDGGEESVRRRRPRGVEKGESPPKKIQNTADVDGDVDDSGGSGSDASGDESESADDESGAAERPSRSCFKGGARAGETSWRDRVDASPSGESPPGESPPSPEREPHSPIVSSAHYLTTTRSLDKRLAKTLTVGRVGSEDSVDEIALSGSDFDFGSARDLSGVDAATSPEGRAAGTRAKGRPTKGQTRSKRQRNRAAAGPRAADIADHPRVRGFSATRRTVSGSDLGAGSTFTTSDGGTESDLGGGGESDLGAYESDRRLPARARAMESGGPGWRCGPGTRTTGRFRRGTDAAPRVGPGVSRRARARRIRGREGRDPSNRRVRTTKGARTAGIDGVRRVPRVAMPEEGSFAARARAEGPAGPRSSSAS